MNTENDLDSPNSFLNMEVDNKAIFALPFAIWHRDI